MRLKTPFDSIVVGETDNFAFDFSYDIGQAFIINGVFNCMLGSHQNINDPSPQTHVNSVGLVTTIALRVPPAGNLILKNGNFVYANIGPFSSSSAGGTYTLQAIAYLSDTRVIELNSTVRVLNTGD